MNIVCHLQLILRKKVLLTVPVSSLNLEVELNSLLLSVKRKRFPDFVASLIRNVPQRCCRARIFLNHIMNEKYIALLLMLLMNT